MPSNPRITLERAKQGEDFGNPVIELTFKVWGFEQAFEVTVPVRTDIYQDEDLVQVAKHRLYQMFGQLNQTVQSFRIPNATFTQILQRGPAVRGGNVELLSEEHLDAIASTGPNAG